MTLKALLLLCSILLYSATSTHAVCTDVNGRVEIGEQCDDGNMRDNDGCSNCIIDPITLLFNDSAPSTEPYEREFFDVDQVTFFVENGDSLSVEFIPPDLTVRRIFLVMVGSEPTASDEIDVYDRDGREILFYNRQRLRVNPTTRRVDDPRIQNVNTFLDLSDITEGMLIEESDQGFFPGEDGLITESEARNLVLAAGYETGVHPDYDRRDFCIILTDDANATTTACLTLLFIGYNDDPPMITYTSEGVASFIEGQAEYVPVINGTITIRDQDHPTRYLQMSAQARIIDFVAGYPEFLDVTVQDPDFTYEFDADAGTLNISGPASTDLYAVLLSNLTYFNSMTEPVGSSRQIELTVFDGIHTSNPATVEVTIINTNDPPAISLDGEAPVITTLAVNYTEGNGSVEIVPTLVVVDSDPVPFIERVSVTLLNPVDEDNEQLGVSSMSGLNVNITLLSPHTVLFSGVATTADYTEAVKRLTYEHRDAAPGNPSTGETRLIEFYIEDDSGASSIVNSTLQLTILPVNDAPILSYVSDETLRSNPQPISDGDSVRTFQYTEDDMPLNFGEDIYLRDVDSNISSVTLQLSNLLNGLQEEVYVDNSLLLDVVIQREDSEDNQTRTLTVIASKTPYTYEQVLRTLTYRNTLSTNQVQDGQRTITISVNDTYQLASTEITALIDVGDRNDPPEINVGDGARAFIEDGPSIPVVLPHVASIMDEEGHNVSRLTAELRSPNGELDMGDAIFLRSPLALPFIDDFRSPPSRSLLDVAVNDTTASYTDLLLSIFYDNNEAEPTLFNATGDLLIREVIITIYDTNFLQDGQMNTEDSNFDDNFGVGVRMVRIRIEIEPINDNPPRILIRAEPDGCAVGSTEVSAEAEGAARRRRDVRAAASRVKKRSRVGDVSKAPKVTLAHAAFVSDCLDTVTVTFDLETSAPVVEITSKLNTILSFDSPQLNSARKFGVWLDYKTLAVVFRECPEFREADLARPTHVLFEAERGDCDWATVCSNNTICYHNHTGCPVSGPYRLTTASKPCQDCTEGPTGQGDDELATYNILTLVLVLVVVLSVFSVALYLCSLSWIRRSRRKPHIPTIQLDPASTAIEIPLDSEKVTHVVQELGAQDFVVTVSSPLPPPYKPGLEKSQKAKKPESMKGNTPEGGKQDGNCEEPDAMGGKKPEFVSRSSEISSRDFTQQRRKRKGKRKSEKVKATDERGREEDEVLLLCEEPPSDSEAGGSTDGGVATLSPVRSHDQARSGEQSHTSREHLSNSSATPTVGVSNSSTTTPTLSLASQDTAPLIAE